MLLNVDPEVLHKCWRRWELMAMLPLYRSEVEGYLRARNPGGPFLASLRSRISLSQQESIMQGTRYDVPLLNALVFYVGIEVRCVTSHLCGM